MVRLVGKRILVNRLLLTLHSRGHASEPLGFGGRSVDGADCEGAAGACSAGAPGGGSRNRPRTGRSRPISDRFAGILCRLPRSSRRLSTRASAFFARDRLPERAPDLSSAAQPRVTASFPGPFFSWRPRSRSPEGAHMLPRPSHRCQVTRGRALGKAARLRLALAAVDRLLQPSFRGGARAFVNYDGPGCAWWKRRFALVTFRPQVLAPSERFLAPLRREALRDRAYQDKALPIATSRRSPNPTCRGDERGARALGRRAGSRDGTGPGTRPGSRRARRSCSRSSAPLFVQQARARLESLGYYNVLLKSAMAPSWTEHAPFDAIL